MTKGYKQIKGIDYKETYAPVSRLATLRIVLAFTSEKNWECHQMDVVTAFLNPKIDQENVLMELPELEHLGNLPEKSSPIVRLKKALYSLKQAPRLWFIEINSYLLSLGFCQSSVEPSLYIADSVILLLYVDDMLILFKDISVGEEIKQRLQDKYKMTDLGPVKRFLGMTIERTANGYNLHQESYIESLLSKHSMTDSYNACTPIETHAKLDIKSGDIDALVDQKAYLAIVGSLMYAALGTRPDISYAVGLLSRFNSDPRTRHLTAAKRVLRYLKRTKDLKLEYKQTGRKLQGFVDSDWANEKDRKSIGGYTFTLGGAAVSWASKKQTIVAQSTEEAEYTAFTECYTPTGTPVATEHPATGPGKTTGARRHTNDHSTMTKWPAWYSNIRIQRWGAKPEMDLRYRGYITHRRTRESHPDRQSKHAKDTDAGT